MDEVHDETQHPPVTTAKASGGSKMMALMQMWKEESQRKDDAWRIEMKLRREDARREHKGEKRDDWKKCKLR